MTLKGSLHHWKVPSKSCQRKAIDKINKMVDQAEKIKNKNEASTERDLCRLCFSMSDLFIPIFKGEGLANKLSEKIQKYLPVKIFENDSLPHQICQNCRNTLLAWDVLYMSCLKTQEKLQSLEAKNEAHSNASNDESHDEMLIPLKKRRSIEDGGDKGNVKHSERVSNDKSKAEMKENKIKKVGHVNEKFANQREKIKRKYSTRTATYGRKKGGEIEEPKRPESGGGQENEGQTISSQKHDIFERNAENSGNGNSELPESVQPKKKSRRNSPKKSGTRQCKTCERSYEAEEKTAQDEVREHQTDRIECSVCPESFDSKNLNVHLESAHGVEQPETETDLKFKCQFCEKRFKSNRARKVHAKEVHMSEPVQCDLCDFRGTRLVVRRHNKCVHVEKRFLCPQCPNAFKTSHTLKLHMTSHSDVRCYTCDICGMGFKRLNNVRDHVKCHQKKSNQCQICGNFFARKRYLALHEKTIHNFYADGMVPEERGFECEICGAKLKWKKNMLAHKRIHTREKPYACKVRDKNFSSHGTLRTHMAKHDGAHEKNGQIPFSPLVVADSIEIIL